jgi:hypothetical protein
LEGAESVCRLDWHLRQIPKDPYFRPRFHPVREKRD